MSPKLSVVVVAYNHERYIAKALDSILEQKTNFPFDILVFEDGSTDSTFEITEEYRKKYPDKIKVYANQKNVGIRNNVLSTFDKVKGEYFAILDGDDYWCYSEKLQKQVDFLDSYPDYNGIFHDAKIIQVGEAEKILFGYKKYYSQIYNFNETDYPANVISREITVPSSSTVIRVSALKDMDKSLFSDRYSLLWKIACLAVRWSKFYFVNEVWSVYHNHVGGISKGNKLDFHLSHIYFLERLLKDDFYKDYPHDVYKAISHEYQVILNSCDGIDKKKMYRRYFWNELKRLRCYRKEIFKNKS